MPSCGVFEHASGDDSGRTHGDAGAARNRIEPALGRERRRRPIVAPEAAIARDRRRPVPVGLIFSRFHCEASAGFIAARREPRTIYPVGTRVFTPMPSMPPGPTDSRQSTQQSQHPRVVAVPATLARGEAHLTLPQGAQTSTL